MLRSIGLFLALCLAVPVHAQERPQAPSFDIDGTVGAGISDLVRGDLVGYVDATASFRLSHRVPLDFEFGTYLFALDGKNPHETYAALVWNDRFKLGALRPAFDAVLPSVFAERAPFLAYSRAEYTRSHNTVEAMRRTAVPWGLSAEGTSGKVDWIVSVHDAEKGSFRSISAAMTWHGDGWRVMAATESLWSRSAEHKGVNAKLGAAFDIGPAAFEIAALHPEANNRPNALAASLTVPLSNRLTLATMGEFTEDGRDDAYGLALDVSFRDHGTLSLAATDGALGPGLHMTFNHRF